ncbi:MAG: response regulator [Myxococcus sp.]|nr:response regulator [Myxococcus sp.]
MIVDDEASVRMFLRKAVLRCGFVPLISANAAEAEATIRSTHFDCAIVDKNLPDGSGLELLDLIRAQRPDSDVIIITGYVNSQSAIDALRLGAVDYLCKPFDFDTLEHRLKAVVERRKSLSQQARLESMLAHADRLSSLGTMAAGVVHEINNPLACVTANLNFVDEELRELMVELPAESAARLEGCLEALRDAREGTLRAVTIVKDLRIFSRRDETEVELVSLEASLDAAVKVATPSIKGKAVVERRYGDSASIRCSRTRLEQVFLNLIVNAGQAVGSTGRSDGAITLTTSTSEAGEAVVEISDNGTGMTPEVKARLFEPFFTTKGEGEGTGLGLSVCHGIITGAGGRIDVRSEPGQGTTFRLTFPAAPAESTPARMVGKVA